MIIQRRRRLRSAPLLLSLCIASAAVGPALGDSIFTARNLNASQTDSSTDKQEAVGKLAKNNLLSLDKGDLASGVNRTAAMPATAGSAFFGAESNKFALLAHPQSQTVKQGTDVTLSVSATGIPPITYQWYRDGRIVRNATKPELIITNAQPHHRGIYWVRIDAANGAALSRDAILRVLPHNDDFANRSILSGYRIRFASGSNYSAGKEEGEPDHGGTRSSVWWGWRAPVTSKVWIDTRESNFDTVLAVYTGHSVSNLTLVASNDQSGEHNASKVIFEAQAGTEYQIAVEGNAQEVGGIVMNLYVDHLHFSFFSIAENTEYFELTGFPNTPFVLEASADLKTWNRIIEGELTGGASENIHPLSKDAVRFYRAYTPQ